MSTRVLEPVLSGAPPPSSQKVRARYDETPTLSNTLERLVENEKGEKKRKATEGLMWLLRGQQFTCKALQNAQASASMELVEAFGKSYEVTLKRHHNFLVKGVFSVGPFSPSIRCCAGVYHRLSARDESLPLSRRFLQQIEGRPRGCSLF